MACSCAPGHCFYFIYSLLYTAINEHKVSNLCMEGTFRCSANYVPLSPISFIQRSAIVYHDVPSIVYGSIRFTWSQTFHRCKCLASSLAQLAVSYGDVVASLIPNTPAMYELYFGVPMAGAILCALNTRLDSTMVSILLKHSNSKAIFVDIQYLDVVTKAIKNLSKTTTKLPTIILVLDEQAHATSITTFVPEYLEYESFIARGEPEFEIRWPKEERDPIALNYTSGTTSNPKGVVCSHRGAYLNSLATVIYNEIAAVPVYLWTLPMFHCNGWCFTWGNAVKGATNVCLRSITAKAIFDSVVEHKVNFLCGAPTVLNMIINATHIEKKPLPAGKVTVITGAAPPPPPVIFQMEELGFNVLHAYGLSETYGPATLCTWKPEWDALPPDERARMKARQGVNHVTLEEIDIKDPVTMQSVPHDAKTMGEVMIRGNTVMNGYLNDSKATQEAFKGGWFHTGDLGVKHPDGYIQLKDRSKDIIISGGENISTIEVESVLFKHPAVLDVAVVGRPDVHWGETPCAFVMVKDGVSVTAEELIKFCRDNMPHYMAPRSVVFDELLKTSTGKTQKFVLREKAKAMGSLSTTRPSSKL